ncbi:hypothetical protein GWK08_13380 [Leptobacterium flavescens]|uniref:Uncharacterized protein n=1 Tax=Leptobacterium flavescens TaxID=472055 RepID=A0A6P0UPP1_9FLAO|nr:hypothetical protein [Leptobacterium flavescens]NER14440.1 hypothetical protein [Leptobacterium flavescens]
MRKIALLTLLILFIAPVKAQNIVDNSRGGQIDVILRNNSNQPVDGALGSPYISENFIPAKVNAFNEIYSVRYNGAVDAMEFKSSDDKILVLDKLSEYTISFATADKKTYQTVTFDSGKRGFAVLLWNDEDSKSGLYLKERVEFIPRQPAVSSYSKDQPAKYKRVKDVFFFKGTNGVLKEISTKKKKFYALFEGKEKEVQQFVKKNKLKISKQQDLVKIISFYLGKEQA